MQGPTNNKNDKDEALLPVPIKKDGDREGMIAHMDAALIQRHAEFLDEVDDSLDSSDLEAKAASLYYLQRYIHAAERQSLRDNNLPIPAVIEYAIDERKFAREIDIMRRIFKTLDYSEAYLNELDQSVDTVHEALRRSDFVRETQDAWPHLGPVYRKMALHHIQKIHAQTQNIAGVQTPPTLTMQFNQSAITPAATPDALPTIVFAYQTDNLDEAAGISALGQACIQKSGTAPPLRPKIFYNTHADTNFVTRDFATAASTVHHEQHHVMQSALMLAYAQGRIPKCHPIARDVEIMWVLHKQRAYITHALQSVYRIQHKEQDTYYIEHRMQERLALRLSA
ncbi:hypothetical protein [Micavibrio aeruginosavorus]|uniref:hypothetical protein n=1 Tax=Micavibrio aeruginosavorus TaxID=349221 RepID=UPI003F4AD1CC